MKYQIVEIKDAIAAKVLYTRSALTFEGVVMDEDNLDRLVRWFGKYGASLKTPRFYHISGATMNALYGLTGDNAYKPGLDILAVDPLDMDGMLKLALARFELGGRWFDDIVDNNERRQQEQAGDNADDE